MTENDFILGESEKEVIDEIEKEFQEGFEIIQSSHPNKQSASYFYAYDIGNKCLRLKYYSIIEPRKIDWKQRRKFSVNSGIHKSFQTALVAKGWTVEQSKHKMYNELGFELSVSFDAIYGGISHPEKLIEIKVPWFFSKLESPYEPNVCQIQQYMDILGLNEGTIVYIDALSGKTRSFKVLRDDKIITGNLERLEDVRYALLKRVLPEKSRNYRCSGCLYKIECKENVNLGDLKGL